MKSMIVPLLATASFSTFLICGMVAASSLHLGYTPHKFANINASIWSSSPVRVDRSQQAYTREANDQPIQIAVNEKANHAEAAQSTPAPMEDRPSTIQDMQQVAVTGTSESTRWCQARYKSYRASDNSYQPLDGNARRQCDGAPQPVDIGAISGNTPAATLAQNSDMNHAGWCQARYSSYRASDDTYQPFNSPERRRCTSPMTLASNG